MLARGNIFYTKIIYLATGYKLYESEVLLTSDAKLNCTVYLSYQSQWNHRW